MLHLIWFAAFMVLIALAFLLSPPWRSAITQRVWLWRIAWANRPRRPLFALAGVGLALSLGACASVGGGAQSAAFTATQGFIVAETAFDTAVVTADMAVNSGVLPAATVTRLKADIDAGYGYVKIGRAAVTAGDVATAGSQAAALQALVAEISALSKP